MRRTAAIVLVFTCGGLNVACDSLYYKAMKKVGYEKRDILLKRVREARKSQVEAQEDVKSALERFQAGGGRAPGRAGGPPHPPAGRRA